MMTRTSVGTLLIGAVGLAASAAWIVQHQNVQTLRAQVQQEQATAKTREQLTMQVQTQRSSQVAPSELAALRTDHAAVAQLRLALELLKRRSAASTNAPTDAPSSQVTNTWQNAGRATAAATLETVLWAAGSGDTATLVNAIELEPAARARAAVLFDSLLPAFRSQYTSPDDLVARFTAQTVDVLAMKVALEKGDAERRQLSVALQQPDLSWQQANLSLQHRDDGWRLLVPVSAVEAYGELLKRSGAIASSGS